MTRTLDDLLSPADQQRVVAAIRAAEQTTSGQIKVHVEARCRGGDAYHRAAELFHRLGLERTRARNGVLLYVAVRDRKFALIGDSGIHEEVGSAFWHEAVARMRTAFQSGDLGAGLVGAISAVGERLAKRFPHHAGDPNEIPDDISFKR